MSGVDPTRVFPVTVAAVLPAALAASTPFAAYRSTLHERTGTHSSTQDDSR